MRISFVLSVPVLFGLMAALAPACSDEGTEHLVTVEVPDKIDILFVIDNSGSMPWRQKALGEAFGDLASILKRRFPGEYQIGVVTIGMESWGCPPCDPPAIVGSCLNDTGESGRLQDRVGRIVDETSGFESFEHFRDPDCRIVTPSNKHCFYDPDTESGIVLVGQNGCGYDKGLAPVRAALTGHLDDYNEGFLRGDASLAVVVFTVEEDCGEVGDVSENIGSAMGNICYFAAKGEGPDGERSHPDDPEARPYHLTPVQEYHDLLTDLKGNRSGMVKYAAIVGVEDTNDPAATQVEYLWDSQRGRWTIKNSCTTPGCQETRCHASPGTRYIEMATLLGLGFNGFVDTICQPSFTDTAQRLGEFLYCPEEFHLSRKLKHPYDADLSINGTPLPGTAWTYQPPDRYAPNGSIRFSKDVDPCSMAAGGKISIEVAD